MKVSQSIMDNKKIKLMFFSATHNTKKVVHAVSKGIGSQAVSNVYDIRLPDFNTEEVVFEAEDILIVGVPVYGGRVPAFLVPIFEKLNGNGAKVVLVATYGNRAYEDALVELRDIFTKDNFTCVAAGAFIGEHSYTTEVGTGRPNADDLKLAEQFGAAIAAKLMQNEETPLLMSGNIPYKERKQMKKMKPDTTDACIQCGKCSKQCPVSAIDRNDAKVIDSERCIICYNCVRVCPVEAKEFNEELITKIKDMLIAHCSETQLEPEWFL